MVQCFRFPFSFYSGSPGLEADEVINFYRDNIISAYNTWRNG